MPSSGGAQNCRWNQPSCQAKQRFVLLCAKRKRLKGGGRSVDAGQLPTTPAKTPEPPSPPGSKLVEARVSTPTPSPRRTSTLIKLEARTRPARARGGRTTQAIPTKHGAHRKTPKAVNLGLTSCWLQRSSSPRGRSLECRPLQPTPRRESCRPDSEK